MTKSLKDIQQDMSLLYDQVNNAQIDLNTASELTNITGKLLRAYELDLTRQVFAGGAPLSQKLLEYRGQN